MSDLTAAVVELGGAAPGYAAGHRMYRGEVDELFASRTIKRLIGETAKGYKVNLARRVVDAVLDRLKVVGVTVPDNPAATARLVEIWDANALGRTSKTLFRTALSEGDAYLYVWPNPDNPDQVDVFLRSPARTRVFYDPENPNRKTHAAFVWTVGSGEERRTRVNLLYPDRIERYITKPGMDGRDDEDFEPYAEDDQDDWEIENPFGEVPVFHFRTDEPYGRPEHFDAFGPQNAINKLVAVHMSSVDYQGFPQRYRLKDVRTADMLPDAGMYRATEEPGDPVVEPDDDDALVGGPGTMLDLANTRSAGSFPAADGSRFTEAINFYARAMGASTATPLRFMDPTGDVPSGESLRADDAPLTERIGDRQAWFGDELRAALLFALRLAGIEVPTVKVDWKPVQIINDREGWETVRAKIDAGVPQEVALAEAGYRPEQVEEWLKGSETTNLATRVELVGKIAAAMQGLGAAVALGVLSQTQVAEVVAELLGDSTEDDPAE